MKCISCNHEQETGKFCAKCGTAMNQSEEAAQIAATQTGPAATPSQPNPNVEQVKAIAQNYIGAFVGLFKKPTSASTNEGLFVNGIISLIILNLLLGLGTTAILNKFFNNVLGLANDFMSLLGSGGLSSSNAFSMKYVFIFAIVYALLGLVTIAVVFFVNKLFVEERSFKSIFVAMTNFYPITIVVIVVAYVLTLLGALKFSFYILLASLTLVLTLIPLFTMSRLMENKVTKFDKFFVYVTAFVAVSILSYFVSYISFSQLLGSIDVEDILSDIFYKSLW